MNKILKVIKKPFKYSKQLTIKFCNFAGRCKNLRRGADNSRGGAKNLRRGAHLPPPVNPPMCGWSISNGQLIVEWANEHDQSALAKFIKICKCRATNESNKKCSACTCGRLLVLNNVKYVAGYAKPNKCVTILPTEQLVYQRTTLIQLFYYSS